MGSRFKPLNPLLHSELRLAVMSLLVSVDEADFVWLRTLSVQIDNLAAAGYVEVEKGFSGKRPRTTCRITPQGLHAFSDYVEALKGYIVK